ncbi:transcriptional repressor [Gilvimarinus agarilyticus]|uniref:Fur family transcriptional regulator n=1 Tax=unclassified Gilvimarinus TaxID=2642066 RepID=UPI001C0A28D5|nr:MULTISPECIES: transcriptional repressor [unclassified Gilvimarinus]MBU2884357.1 transcriptional repressor [Gilvimarinus agarilyticus]MDO6569493.1 transcriptional repressor [Gilvimarinus sp. 2_MG-2023]MDO6748171.1 transcriptional repressor [Gilvimarinus sp. 1_MG-2023]
MNRTESIIQQAELHCQSRGSRLTAKRKQVLSGLIESGKAMSAYELIDFCKQHYGDSFSAMSIYRILEFLEEEHLAHRLNIANKYVACAHINCEHEHDTPQFLICRKCHKVREIRIKADTITNLKTNVADAGFTLSTPQLEMNCLCNDCKPHNA